MVLVLQYSKKEPRGVLFLNHLFVAVFDTAKI